MSGSDLRQQADEAIAKMADLGIEDLAASIEGDVVTLTGTARDVATKAKAMVAFNTFVVAANTLNMIRVDLDRMSPQKATLAMPAPRTMDHRTSPAVETQRIHVVLKGETLSGIAEKHYGKASEYLRIFNANRDVLNDPDVVTPGLRLRIP